MRNGILIDNETGDLQIKPRRDKYGKIAGGLVIGDARADVAQRILEAYPGEFKEKPQLGCFAKQQINGTPDPFWRGNAISQLRSEGIEVLRLEIMDNAIELELK